MFNNDLGSHVSPRGTKIPQETLDSRTRDRFAVIEDEQVHVASQRTQVAECRIRCRI
jgi:hypothetical protein